MPSLASMNSTTAANTNLMKAVDMNSVTVVSANIERILAFKHVIRLSFDIHGHVIIYIIKLQIEYCTYQ